jgi:hypothetical protein
MRVNVNYSDGNDAMVANFTAADFSIMEDGSLFVQKPNGNNVFFNARSWYRVDIDNSGK